MGVEEGGGMLLKMSFKKTFNINKVIEILHFYIALLF